MGVSLISTQLVRPTKFELVTFRVGVLFFLFFIVV